MGFENMNKKGFQIQLGMFAIIACSLAILAASVVITEWNSQYSSGITNDLGDFEKLNNISQKIQQQKEGTAAKSSESGDDFQATSIKGSFGVINGIFTSFELVLGKGGMLDSARIRFGIPDYVMQALYAFMIIAIVIAIITVVLRLQRLP